MIIKPTVGRIVWYYREDTDPGPSTDGQPLAAVVAWVWDDTMVNLHVIDSNGHGYSRASVRLVQEGGLMPNGRYCAWMPYQKGQAAKTEALEAAAKA